ncbi:Hypothetical predicted protein [Olea europaea subsp. europaea]|uniref:Transmembrane protein n=1 Tax=Olea europaea subsp. europaea TaxID=158383 RepID=A0A8S0R4M9_OLEEU|nr:Hypothetical predicted protein [Olea europaea subsp. europaea]
MTMANTDSNSIVVGGVFYCDWWCFVVVVFTPQSGALWWWWPVFVGDLIYLYSDFILYRSTVHCGGDGYAFMLGWVASMVVGGGGGHHMCSQHSQPGARCLVMQQSDRDR